jgi:phthalate 4,5-dioxygenase oxygenase subunit
MVTRPENELMTAVEGEAPLGRLMREHYWVPFALSANLVAGDAPTPVRLFGVDYVAFRAPDGRIGFFDERCPHRRASLLLARAEGDGLRCIYHRWKIDVSGRVVEAPTQVIRHDQFCAGVRVSHFPVHEEGGMAWVWLGGGETPPFPDLPFNDAYGSKMVLTVSLVPANWLQGLEGGIDSVHAPILHRSVIQAMLEEKGAGSDTAGVRATFAAPPQYETEESVFGMRQVSLRRAGEDQVYVRVAHFFFPLVVVVPNGYAGATHVFCFAPVDDGHHLVFFGNYGETPLSLREVSGALAGDLPDPRNFASLDGDRSNRWGQDRRLMKNGHWSGFGGSAIQEDTAVQASMGSIADRMKENLSSSDVAVAQTRRLLLETIAAYKVGELPPGSARTPGGVRVPQPFDALLGRDESWRSLPTEVP